jgi:hypothetical protein
MYWVSYVCLRCFFNGKEMRKGWKTRIDERRYFENKKDERDQKIQFFRTMRQHMYEQMQMELATRSKHEIN